MNSNNRLAVWLHEHFSFFKPEPLVKDLLRFLEGEMSETVLSALSTDGSLRVTVDSKSGKLLYDKIKSNRRDCHKQRCVIEQVEFIPHEGKGFSFTVVDNEITIVRRNGSNPEYSPKIPPKEMAEISVFINQLRLKTEEFLRAHI